MAGLSLQKKGLALEFDYDPMTVAEVKLQLSGSRWSKRDKVWYVPWELAHQAVDFATSRGWLVGESVRGRIARWTLDPDEAVARGHEMMERIGEELYFYQPRGIRHLALHRNALLGWEMRTGKTIVSLAAHPPSAPLLLVAPATALYQWADEIETLRPDLTPVVVKRSTWRWPKDGEAVIGSWAGLPKAEINPRGWAEPREGAPDNLTFVLDEIHKAKNPGSQRTQNAVALLKGVRAVGARSWALTGTPVQNHPLELWHLLKALGMEKAVFGSWPSFLELYNAKKVYGVLEFGAPDPSVPDRLRRVMHRMTFAEAAPHIKSRPPRFLPVEINASARKRKLWEESYESFNDAIRNAEIAPMDFGDARKELAELKAQSLPQVISDIEDSGGGPILVFSQHRKPIEDLAARKGWSTILGGVDKETREESRKAFQRGDLKGLGITIGAGQEALTLSRAKTMVFVDLSWNPTSNAQAMARGLAVSDDEAPLILVMVARGTVDERQQADLLRKTRMIEGTLGDRRPPPSRREVRKRRAR